MYLLQLVFQPVAVVGKLLQNKETDSCIQEEKQHTKEYKNIRIHKIESKLPKKKTNIKRHFYVPFSVNSVQPRKAVTPYVEY